MSEFTINDQLAKLLAKKANKYFKGCPKCGVVPAHFQIGERVVEPRIYFVTYFCMTCWELLFIKGYSTTTLEEVELEKGTCKRCGKETVEILQYCKDCLNKLRDSVTNDYIG
jgi:hypothetical protein